jgi:hypothetical protein
LQTPSREVNDKTVPYCFPHQLSNMFAVTPQQKGIYVPFCFPHQLMFSFIVHFGHDFAFNLVIKYKEI